jgi:hypothetical protein
MSGVYKFPNSEYGVHQVGPKDSESQNFWFPGIERAAVGVVQNVFITQIMCFIHKK